MSKTKEYYIRAFGIFARTFDSFEPDKVPAKLKEEGLNLIKGFIQDFGVLDTQEWGYSTYTHMLKVWFSSSAFLYIRKKPWVIPTQKSATDLLSAIGTLQNLDKLDDEIKPINIREMAIDVLMKIKYARGDFDEWTEEKISEFRMKPRHSLSPFLTKDEWRAYGIILKAEESGL